MTVHNRVGVNTWVWTSPLTDTTLASIAAKVSGWGFDVLELPVENLGDWTPEQAARVLGDLGLGATVCLVMPRGRELVRADTATVKSTQDYLCGVVDAAAVVGSTVIAGPAYASVGRTWRMRPADRAAAYAELRENLAPVVSYAGDAGITLAVEPLNRYETSLLNTVAQTLEAIGDLPHCGVALDLYHQNIEEADPIGAITAAAGRIAHVQVCGNDRGAPGPDHLDWPGILTAVAGAGYAGPLCIESFTGENAAIATAASIWRPLAPTQDDLALTGLAHLREVMRAL